MGNDNEQVFDFLLPNGFVVTINCCITVPLGDIKTQLWSHAVKLPAANLLHNPEKYVFIGVTIDGDEVEFKATTRLADLQLIYPILEVSEPKETRDLNRLEKVIGEVISQPVLYLDSVQDSELQTFRRDINRYCREEILPVRERWTPEEQALFFYPPDLDLNSDLQMKTVDKILKANNQMAVHVWIMEDVITSTYKVTVHTTDTPMQVVKATIETKYRQKSYSEDLIQKFIGKADLFALKVCGREQYLLKDCCLHMYQYVRDCLEHDRIPELKLVSVANLHRHMQDNTCLVLPDIPPPTPPPVTTVTSSWDLQQCRYSIRVFNLPGKGSDLQDCTMYVRAQLFHGTQQLCKPIRTLDEGWNRPWNFDISIQNLPRCARLCFTVCAVKNGSQWVSGISWVNIQVFDADGRLTTGRREIGVWPFPRLDGQNPTKYPQGPPGGNYKRNAPSLDFEVISPYNGVIEYPSSDEIDRRLHLENKIESEKDVRRRRNSICKIMKKQGVSAFDKIDKMAAKDPLFSLDREDQELLWINRNLVMDYAPNILPKLIQCVNWLERDQVFELYRLLGKWPRDQIYLCTTVQLLDVDFPDTRVRDFAVQLLERQLTNDVQVLNLYLLQLAQIVRLESYRDNRLCRFLLRMALLYKRVGHSFFWHMRSELHDEMSKNRFSPILEAYCRFCGAAVLRGLAQEIRSLDKCIEVSKVIKRHSDWEDIDIVLRQLLQDATTHDAISMTTSILDPAIELGEICPEKCKVMMSKMKPLWLDWNNQSSMVDEVGHKNIEYIFKDGDDLRQDMLVLQLIRVMNMIWKSTSHDYGLIPYGCISLGDDVGLIEVVRNSTTVHNIISGIGIIDSSKMNEWLHSQNKERYEEAVKTFTYSCAGYCVATYILGIGDRHSDNIMLTRDGQLFHIDYGHFMGTAKTKLGIKRNRVPFVLTNDFINIIAKGKQNPETSAEFEKFMYLCFEAYIQLRRHSSLLLTLLKLMMHSNIPELNQTAHIQYAQRSLAVDKTETEAGIHFLETLLMAAQKQWTTKVDWFFHLVNKVMTKKST